MLFRDYVELLYQAYLQDKGYLQTLRQRIRSEEWNKDQMRDPAFEDWKSIDPRNPEIQNSNRIKFHPNPYDPQQGVYTYEARPIARKDLRIIRERLSRRKRYDKHQESKD